MGDATNEVWIYDARANMPAYGKTNPFKAEDLAEFRRAFGNDSLGSAKRIDQGAEGRFRRFTRAEIAERGDNLDISWLKDSSGDPEDGLETPEEIAAAIELHLANALVEARALVEELEDSASEPVLTEVAE